MHLYCRDADDTLEWIQEKENVVSSDDFGHDLESSQALISRHEGLEVRLCALNSCTSLFLQEVKISWYLMVQKG